MVEDRVKQYGQTIEVRCLYGYPLLLELDEYLLALLSLLAIEYTNNKECAVFALFG